MIQKIECIDIWSENYQALAEWYTNILELKPVQQLALPDDTGTVFDIGGIFLYIGQHSQVKNHAKDPFRIMIEFRVDSVTRTYEQLVDKGVKFIRTPELASTADMHVATAYDLDGNIIQFIGDR